MIIAVDFDGTIVEHRYPEIGREKPFAFDTLKMLQKEGHRLILWTVREDKLLEEAVDFCRQHGVEFYAVNTNYPEEQEAHQHFSRKLKADVFIDDRNLGGMLDWGSIYRIIHYRLKIADLVAETLDDRLEEGIDRMGDQYDLIILDPPAFAKHRDALRNALRGYTKLNAKAFEKIRPGGILFTFSCSQVVNKQDFRNAVFTAAAQSGRSVRILHQLTQPGDHPVNIYHPEGEYLKGLVLYVE